uniref:Reverse transcriptase/retrotransposon-derived protein RNase H-like domain-containing protein n=1 Tax=Tanacetum cinerariifolium TaxID=118510 RepID=A0A6L2J1B8_TANCI|nr:hypothetical protein [Tanacetum cinerariifolium]
MEATFIKGLKTNLRATIRVMKLEGLYHAMELAISIEDNQRVARSGFNRNSILSPAQSVTPKGSDSASSTATKGGPGHQCAKKTLHILLVDDNDNEEEEEEEEEVSRGEDDYVHLDMVEVSLNSVLGFTPPRSTDVILGIKWLGTLGDMSVDWKKLTMSFGEGSNRVMIQGDPSLCRTMVSYKSLIRSLRHEQEGFMIEVKRLENVPAPNSTITTEIEALIDKYEDVFCPPCSLPPNQDHKNAIVLQNGTTPEQTEYLRHIVSGKEVEADPSKISAMLEWPIPKNLGELWGFLGLTGYYKKLVKGYSKIARALTEQLKKDNFNWNSKVTQAFRALQNAMTKVHVLALLDFNKEFMVETDASRHGIEAVLMQSGRPIAFYSQVLGPWARKKSAKKIRPHVLSRRVEIASCLAILLPHFQNWDALIRELKHDPELEKIKQNVITGVEGFEEYRVEDDCLLYKGHIGVAPYFQLDTTIVPRVPY